MGLGDAYSMADSRDLASALEVYEQALTVREDLARADPQNVNAQPAIGWVLAALARVYAEMEQPAKALAFVERAMALDARYPSRSALGHRLSVARAWAEIGEASLRQGLRAQACRAFRESHHEFTTTAPKLDLPVSATPRLAEIRQRVGTRVEASKTEVR